MGALLLGATLRGGIDQAISVRVDDSTLQFAFASGRFQVFRFDDPRLTLRFLDYTANRQDPNPGQPRTVLWRGFARYAIPRELLPEICYRARAAGLYVTESMRNMGSRPSTLTVIARAPPRS